MEQNTFTASRIKIVLVTLNRIYEDCGEIIAGLMKDGGEDAVTADVEFSKAYTALDKAISNIAAVAISVEAKRIAENLRQNENI